MINSDVIGSRRRPESQAETAYDFAVQTPAGHFFPRGPTLGGSIRPSRTHPRACSLSSRMRVNHVGLCLC